MPVADIDFTGTEGSQYLKEGVYRARLESVEQKDGSNYPLWVWTFASMEPETAGQINSYTTSLSPKAAFYIRQVIEALGAEAPGGMARINTNNYLKRQAMIQVGKDGNTYTGKDGNTYDSVKILRVFPIMDGAQPQAATPAALANDGDPGPMEPAPRGAEFGDDIPW